MASEYSSRFRLVIYAAGSLLAIAFLAATALYSGTDMNDWTVRLSQVGYRGIFILMPVCFLFILAGAGRWFFILKATHSDLDDKLDRGFALGATSLGHVFVHVLPVPVAAGAARLIMLRLAGSKAWKSVIGTTVIEQAIDLMMALCGLIAFFSFIHSGGDVYAYAAVLFCGFAVSALASFAALLNVAGCAKMLIRLIPSTKFAAVIGKLQTRLAGEALMQPTSFLILWLYSVLRLSLFLAVYVLVAILAGLGSYAPYMLVVMPVVQLCNVVAVVPGNIGLVEGAMMGLLLSLGVPAETAGSFSLVARPVVLAANSAVAAVLLSAIWLFRRRGNSWRV